MYTLGLTTVKRMLLMNMWEIYVGVQSGVTETSPEKTEYTQPGEVTEKEPTEN